MLWNRVTVQYTPTVWELVEPGEDRDQLGFFLTFLETRSVRNFCPEPARLGVGGRRAYAKNQVVQNLPLH